MTVMVLSSYLNGGFSRCVLGGTCRAYLPEPATSGHINPALDVKAVKRGQ